MTKTLSQKEPRNCPPDLPDVQRVGRTFLGSRTLPDLLDVQRVGLVSEALAEPKTSGCRVSLEHCANLVWRLGQGWQSYWQQVF